MLYYLLPLSFICECFRVLGIFSNNLFYTGYKFVIIFLGFYYISRYNNKKYEYFLFYILYLMLTGLKYSFNDVSFNIYISALIEQILPMFMFYIGTAKNIDHKKLMTVMICSFAIMLTFTLYAYFTMPSWYVSYLNGLKGLSDKEYGETYYSTYMRFTGTWANSYDVMYLGFAVFSYSIVRIFVGNYRRFYMYYVAAISFIALILCQQRSAIAGSIVVLIVMFAYYVRNFKRRKLSIGWMVAIVIMMIMGAFYYFADRVSELSLMFDDILKRFSFTQAFSERADKVFRVFDVWKDPFFGDGLGIYSQAAHFSGYISVNDCEWIKMLTETGIVGLFMFIYIILKQIKKALLNYRYYYFELAVVIFYLVAMIGSDSLSMESIMSIFFWYSLGSINRIKEKDEIYSSNTSIQGCVPKSYN